MSAPQPFWAWAVQAYGREGVKAVALDLQDRHGHSIPFLLWVAWMAHQGRSPSAGMLGEGADITRGWEAEVVSPLRQVRRRLRGAGAEGLRDQVKAAELEAERTLMARLESLAPAAAGAAGVEAAVLAAGRAWEASADPEPLKVFASILR